MRVINIENPLQNLLYSSMKKTCKIYTTFCLKNKLRIPWMTYPCSKK